MKTPAKAFLLLFLIPVLLGSCSKSKRNLVTSNREVSSLNISGQELTKTANPSLIEGCKVVFREDSTFKINIMGDVKHEGKWMMNKQESVIHSLPSGQNDTISYEIKELNDKKMVLFTKDANAEMTITLEKGKKE